MRLQTVRLIVLLPSASSRHRSQPTRRRGGRSLGVGSSKRAQGLGEEKTGSDSNNSLSCPNAGEHRKAKRGSVPVRAAPNQALHLTASSLRSCLAPASGGR